MKNAQGILWLWGLLLLVTVGCSSHGVSETKAETQIGSVRQSETLHIDTKVTSGSIRVTVVISTANMPQSTASQKALRRL